MSEVFIAGLLGAITTLLVVNYANVTSPLAAVGIAILSGAFWIFAIGAQQR